MKALSLLWLLATFALMWLSNRPMTPAVLWSMLAIVSMGMGSLMAALVLMVVP